MILNHEHQHPPSTTTPTGPVSRWCYAAILASMGMVAFVVFGYNFTRGLW